MRAHILDAARVNIGLRNWNMRLSKIITLTTVFLLLVSLSVLAAEPVRVYVSPTGKDDNTGSAEKPFATLERARQEARKLKSADGAIASVAPGVYHIAKTLALGREDSGVAYSGGPGVVLTGSREVPASAWLPAAQSTNANRLNPSAKSKIVVLDLVKNGFQKPATLRPNFGMPFNQPELFCNGKRMTLSQWPNGGWSTIEKISSSGTVPSSGSASDASKPRMQGNEGGVFTYSGDRPAAWNTAEGVWLQGFWCFDWMDEVIQVASIDAAKKQIALKTAHTYGVRKGNPSPRRWRALNLIEEIDEPGEYAVDAKTGLLYFYLPCKLEDAHISLAEHSLPLVKISAATNITFQGFTFEESRASMVVVEKSDRVIIQDCIFRNGNSIALSISEGRSNQVTGCDIYNMGSGGIRLEGGDRKTLTPAGHLAENNHIWNFSMYKPTYASAFHLGGVGNRMAHNFVHDAPHQAIAISGNNHVIEYNIISNVCNYADDAAACYKGRNPSCTGNIIRYNIWRDIGRPMGHGSAAIYFDDGDSGDLVYGNIFYRAGDKGKGSFGSVFSHGGCMNRADNNIFIECTRALGSSPWNQKRWTDYIAAPLWQTRLKQEIDITKPPYTTAYPALKTFMDPWPDEIRYNYSSNNVFAACGEVLKNRWVTNQTDFVTATDPGFVNLAKGDFRLKKNSVIFTYNPGFQPIPVEQIGLLPNRRNRQ